MNEKEYARLTPFHKLPTPNSANILLVGVQGIGRHLLAKALVELQTPFTLQIRTATSLPLAASNAEGRPRIDLVVFVVDLTNKLSMKVIEECTVNLDPYYFLGKACFVITEVDKFHKRSVELETITKLSEAYGCHLLQANMQEESSCQSVARQLYHIVEVSAGLRPTVSPMLVQSTKHYSTSLL